LKKKPLSKASIDEFYLDITGMDRFHGLLDKRTLTINHKETGLPLSLHYRLTRRFQKLANQKTGKLEIPETMVKSFEPLSIKKIPMVGDVTFNYCRALAFEPFKRYQKCLQRCCSK
jgi:DNA polymerase-4